MKVLTLTHMFDHWGGRYSLLCDSDSFMTWVMEREWRFNQRHVSCVPRDEYVLEPHDGGKYKNTYALVGDGVAHWPHEGKPRYACVIHPAVYPSDLQGASRRRARSDREDIPSGRVRRQKS